MRTHYANPKIQKAFDMLEALSADQDVRILTEEREKALRDEISIIGSERRSARREGERKKAVETAKKLLQMGILSTEQIADATGLERAEIDKL